MARVGARHAGQRFREARPASQPRDPSLETNKDCTERLLMKRSGGCLFCETVRGRRRRRGRARGGAGPPALPSVQRRPSRRDGAGAGVACGRGGPWGGGRIDKTPNSSPRAPHRAEDGSRRQTARGDSAGGAAPWRMRAQRG
ncbi:Protein of unknown function [Gryllus bimaculatus]|nr:Protein of unknown function [Gryllus bimaculatus]